MSETKEIKLHQIMVVCRKCGKKSLPLDNGLRYDKKDGIFAVNSSVLHICTCGGVMDYAVVCTTVNEEKEEQVNIVER